jgi:RNA-directed DNA polymerase
VLERAKAVMQYQQWTYVEYARFADDLVVLVDAHPRQLAAHGGGTTTAGGIGETAVEVNGEKSRRVDLTQGESFGFLDFAFRRIRSRRGRWTPLRTPRGTKRTALLQTLKTVFRSHRSRPVAEVIARINPILRGWVQYFAFGHSSRCFSYIQDWVEKKVRHDLARARQRHGFGWKQWSGLLHGHEGEIPATANELPRDHRASSRPYRHSS